MMHDVPVDSRCAASWFVLAAPLLACPIDDLSEGLHDASTPRDVTVLEGSTRLDVRAQDTGPRADAGHDAGRPYMGLFDGKSFQGLKLNDDVRGYGYASGSGSGGYCDIVSIVDGGRDLVYGNTEPRSPYTGKTPNGPVGIWGGSAAYADTMQLDSNAPSDFTRAIVDAAVPTGVSHRVLQLTFATPNEDSVGGVMDNNDFNIFSSYTSPDDIVSTQGMLYFSRWMFLKDDMASRTPFENFGVVLSSTNVDTTGVGLVAESYNGVGESTPVWSLTHYAPGTTFRYFAEVFLSPTEPAAPVDAGALGHNAGQVYKAPVPLGEWFRLEVAWNGHVPGSNGWMWMALTVPGSSDTLLANGVTVYAGSGSFNLNYNGMDPETIGWNALSSSEPINLISPIQAFSNLTRSASSPFWEQLTNIEVWTQWPASGATAHPSGFQ